MVDHCLTDRKKKIIALSLRHSEKKRSLRRYQLLRGKQYHVNRFLNFLEQFMISSSLPNEHQDSNILLYISWLKMVISRK
jgi:hypothetical protein